jgi:hypothetical protein
MPLRIPLKNVHKTLFSISLNSNPVHSWDLCAANISRRIPPNSDLVLPGQVHRHAILSQTFFDGGVLFNGDVKHEVGRNGIAGRVLEDLVDECLTLDEKYFGHRLGLVGRHARGPRLPSGLLKLCPTPAKSRTAEPNA